MFGPGGICRRAQRRVFGRTNVVALGAMPFPVTLNQPEQAIVRVVNIQRRAHGLRTLRTARGLVHLARSHSVDQMRHYRLGHDSSDGTSFGRRLARVGRFRVAGEVVAWASRGGRASAFSIVLMWMRSPRHRAELLDPRFRTLGVGRARGGRGTWVTADLAAR